MRIIISHDIDHINAWDHKKSTIIPKFIIRSTLELINGSISMHEYFLRGNELLTNKWQNLDELMSFDKSNNIPSTFFMGVSNAYGMSYSLKNAEYWITNIINAGFDIGVHGAAFCDPGKIGDEYNIFKSISGLVKFGIRMHYLKYSDEMLNIFDKAGYLFDSTIYTMENCYRVGRLWEFPLHIMDTYLLYGSSKWKAHSLESIKASTKKIIEEALNNNIHYLTILFHDRYFSDSFKSLKEWYIWLISYLMENHFAFISYKDAILEMEKN